MFRSDRLPTNAVSACDAGKAFPASATVFCFSIDVVPDPGTMARVLEQFSKRGLVPTRWHSDVIEPEEMQIEVQVVGLSGGQGEDIARCIRSIVGVNFVLTTGKAGTDRRLRSSPA